MLMLDCWQVSARSCRAISMSSPAILSLSNSRTNGITHHLNPMPNSAWIGHILKTSLHHHHRSTPFHTSSSSRRSSFDNASGPAGERSEAVKSTPTCPDQTDPKGASKRVSQKVPTNTLNFSLPSSSRIWFGTLRSCNVVDVMLMLN